VRRLFAFALIAGTVCAVVWMARLHERIDLSAIGGPAASPRAHPQRLPPAAAAAAAAAAADAADAARPAAPPAGTAPAAAGDPIVLPPVLRHVQFGMPSGQVRRAYSVGWERVRSGELMLAHYPGEDRTTTVRFHFSGDSLYRVELGVAPAEGQSRGELYDTLQAFYAAQYAHARERSATRWSDGTVIAQIGMAENAVEVTFTCPAARR